MTANSFAGLGRHSFIHLFLEHLDIDAPDAGLRASHLACDRAGESGTTLGSGSLGTVRPWCHKKEVPSGTVSFVYMTHILKE